MTGPSSRHAAARTAWVAAQLEKARLLHLDGINFDLEDPIPPGHPLARNYTALVAVTASAFHAAIPGSQVSVDVPWSPFGIDGRSYDWHGLASAADLLFVMAYDMQSQIWGSCVASANSPAALVLRGAQQWLELGIPADKLILGLPWYGYRYPCANPAFAAGQEQLCALPPTPFQGAPCSDAAGDPPASRRFQVWFDSPQSLEAKYALAARLGLRGVGVWHLDCVDYRCSDAACRGETEGMWAALRAFTGAAAGSRQPAKQQTRL
ncbi:di-N-acetylchitobiase [Chlorella sorokiniana]|uniref:Di-N-acetylchitobiase n=1 Tax=Chlorella sorokiniana TaxID=3076 RepID=A0A2P6TM85_CHLSO|nr:di-N-acetylchitobiase [Chlorella sorokiniana]|eukprot:PRW45439.1 di-N-acetylchitobiase [Chlorella sorokiniana]